MSRLAKGDIDAGRAVAPVVANFESKSRLKREQLATLKWFMNEKDGLVSLWLRVECDVAGGVLDFAGTLATEAHVISGWLGIQRLQTRQKCKPVSCPAHLGVNKSLFTLVLKLCISPQILL